MNKRVFLIVLDSLGIGEAKDASLYGDVGSNTLKSIRNANGFSAENLKKLGLFNIDGVGGGVEHPLGVYARLTEKSAGKDTTLGHWELAGIISNKPMPTYPNGFPKEIIEEFEEKIGIKTLCNKPYSGTEVIKDYGEEHIKTGKPIVYTSSDSVFQIATHDKVVPLEKLYFYCETARKMLTGEHAVGRVIARPFTDKYPFIRTPYRKDYSVLPPKKTMLDTIKESSKDVIAVGKINDIFAGQGITESYKTLSNSDGFNRVLELQKKDFNGLCFINFVDFDSVYGHRNDVLGYSKAISDFDVFLGEFIKNLRENDLLIITADHGCDPSTPSTDHSREDVPFIMYKKDIEPKNLGEIDGFDFVSKTVEKYLL